MYNWIDEEIEKDKEILDLVKGMVSSEMYQEISIELLETYTYGYSISKFPVGEILDCDEYDYIESIHVNQTRNGGYTGDEFGGTCSIKIDEDKYLQFNYSV